MLSVKQIDNKTVIKQTPVLLLGVAGIFFAVPMVVGLLSLFLSSDLGGGLFSLLFGCGLGWVLFEFAAKREEIIINQETREFWRNEKGLFRTRTQCLNLQYMDKLVLEKRWRSGRTFLYLLLIDHHQVEYLINIPSVVYLDHAKLARIISEQIQMPLETREVKL